MHNALMAHDVAADRDRLLNDDDLAMLRALPVSARRPNRLRFAMALAGVRPEDVIKATGIGRGTLSHMLNPRKQRTWTLTTVQPLARYLGCTVDDLFPLGPM
jgi:Cro/C1-type HTH DNA-binding domain